MHRILVSFILLGLTFPKLIEAQPISPAQIDSLANKAIKTFNVPGMSLAIVKEGKVIYAKGYGIRSIITKQPVRASYARAKYSNDTVTEKVWQQVKLREILLWKNGTILK